MRRAYGLLKANHSDARSDRLIVFTDAILDRLQERRAEGFIGAMEEYAEDGIGATLFGIGTDFGQEIAYDISQVRGGNYFFLSDYDRIVSVFDEEFDYLVTPIAYDVSLDVSVPFEFDVVDVYGIPVEGDALPHELELAIPTLFLSTRQGGGAILIRVRPGALVDFGAENTIATISLSYTTREGGPATHPAVTGILPVGVGADVTDSYFESNGAQRAVLLLNTVLVLRNACGDVQYGWLDHDYHSAEPDGAIDRLTEFLPYFDTLATGLEDGASDASRTLSQERALVEKLLANIRQRWNR
jgi:Ca-activated chloride channel family protein